MYTVITLYYNHLVTCPRPCVPTTRQVSRGQGLLGFGKGTQEHLGSRLHREWAVGGAQIAPSRSSTPSICSAIIVFIILLCVLEAPSPNHLCASTAWHGSGVYIWVRLSRGAQEEQVQKREGSEGAGGTEQVRVPGARGPRKVREPGPQGRLHPFTNLPGGAGGLGAARAPRHGTRLTRSLPKAWDRTISCSSFFLMYSADRTIPWWVGGEERWVLGEGPRQRKACRGPAGAQ